MSLCTVCGDQYCVQHTPEERGQTKEEVDRPLRTREEREAFLYKKPTDRIAVALKHAHDPVHEPATAK